MESNWNQLIDRYFAGELSEDGLDAFEQLRLTNAEFAESVELQKIALAGLKRMGQRSEIAAMARAYHFKQLLKKWLWIGTSVLIIAGGIAMWYFAAKNKSVVKVNPKVNSTISYRHFSESQSKSNLADSTQQTVSTEKMKSYTQQVNSGKQFVNNTADFKSKHDVTQPVIAHHVATLEKNEYAVQLTNDVLESKVQSKVLNDSKFTNCIEFPVPQQYSSYFENGLIGLKDTLGNVVLKAYYDSISLFYTSFTSKYEVERYVRIITRVRSYSSSNMYFFAGFKNKKWYLISSDLKQLNSQGYDEFADAKLSDGLILVKNEGKYGIMDYMGNLVLNCEFDKIVNEKGKIFGYKGKKRIKINAIKAK